MQSLEYAKRIAYSSEETLLFTYEMAKKYKDTPGVYVECGVAAGAQIIAMAYGAPNKTIFAFDSFEGIPLPSNRDDQMPGIGLLTIVQQSLLPPPGKQVLQSSGATSVSEAEFWHHIETCFGEENKIKTVRGWFEETLPAFVSYPISILRLDGDLYNSTWVCLQHLFPKVIPGGCVIIDDYRLLGCREACEEYFNLISYDPKYSFIKDNDSTVAYFFK